MVALIRTRFPHVDDLELRRRYEVAAEAHWLAVATEEIAISEYRRRCIVEALEPWGGPDDELVDAYTAERNLVVERARPMPGAVETLRLLRSRGIRVGLLTNGPDEWQRRKLSVAGLDAELDAIATSGGLGAAKPEAAAYRGALDLLGTGASETAMVGDSLPNDVVGALEAGLAAAVWLPRAGESGAGLPAGALVARSLDDVPGLLGLG
jgi:putative hydrolase of the HAD superfamily